MSPAVLPLLLGLGLAALVAAVVAVSTHAARRHERASQAQLKYRRRLRREIDGGFRPPAGV